jgi:hypothetical protein
MKLMAFILGALSLILCGVLAVVYRARPLPPEPAIVQARMAFFTNATANLPPTLFTQLEFPLRSNVAYKVQLTTDFINFRDVWTFTNTEGKQGLSWTVNPTTGPWPRVLEQ